MDNHKIKQIPLQRFADILYPLSRLLSRLKNQIHGILGFTISSSHTNANWPLLHIPLPYNSSHYHLSFVNVNLSRPPPLPHPHIMWFNVFTSVLKFSFIILMNWVEYRIDNLWVRSNWFDLTQCLTARYDIQGNTV